jgi:hypothetical protein
LAVLNQPDELTCGRRPIESGKPNCIVRPQAGVVETGSAKGTAGQSVGVHRKTPRKTRRYGMDNGLRRALKTQPLSTRRYPLEPPFSGSSPVAPTTHDHHPPFVPDLLQSAAQSAQVVLAGTFPVLSPVLEALLRLHPSKSRMFITRSLEDRSPNFMNH